MTRGHIEILEGASYRKTSPGSLMKLKGQGRYEEEKENTLRMFQRQGGYEAYLLQQRIPAYPEQVNLHPIAPGKG